VLPPDTPVPFRPETYAAPQVTYEVKADADGLAITDIPHRLAAQFGEGGRPPATSTRATTVSSASSRTRGCTH
jgi:hypothetical protein